jgi:hypothetical protein
MTSDGDLGAQRPDDLRFVVGSVANWKLMECLTVFFPGHLMQKFCRNDRFRLCLVSCNVLHDVPMSVTTLDLATVEQILSSGEFDRLLQTEEHECLDCKGRSTLLGKRWAKSN